MKRYKKSLILIGVCAFFIAGLIFAPLIVEILLGLNFIVLLLLGISRLVLASQKKATFTNFQKPVMAHKVSVHLPISQESPRVVCNTIRSLVNQKYRNLEVIVMCNYTPDDSLWKPVKDFCDNLDARVKFRNIKTVRGHKAGALAMCHKFTDTEAKYIFTVDANYLLHHHAISHAVMLMENSEIDLLQFPRDYINSGTATEGLLEDYNHYFNCYSASANKFYSCLPIGTLSFIKKEVLDDLGGWSDSSITEETELGIALLNKGYKTFFSNEKIGMGLMPATNRDYNKQRSQWIFGNFQSLWHLLKLKSISLKSKWASAIQLTAWLNMLALPYLTILGGTLLLLATGKDIGYMLDIAVVSVFAHLVFQYLVFGISTRFNITKHLYGFLINLNTGLLGAFCWWEYFLNEENPYGKPMKYAKQFNHGFCGLIFSIVLLCCAVVVAKNYSNILGIFIAIYAALSFTAKLLLVGEFKKSREIVRDSIYNIPT